MKKHATNVWNWYKGLRRVWQVAIAVALGLMMIGSIVDDQQQQKLEAAKANQPVIVKTQALKRDYPDVRGLNLEDADKVLKKAGYGTTTDSDSAFGVIIRENFTVCDQHLPKGHLIPLDVSKKCERED